MSKRSFCAIRGRAESQVDRTGLSRAFKRRNGGARAILLGDASMQSEATVVVALLVCGRDGIWRVHGAQIIQAERAQPGFRGGDQAGGEIRRRGPARAEP